MEAASPSAGVEGLISNHNVLQDHHQKLQHKIDDTLSQIATCNADMEAMKEYKDKGKQFTLSKKEVRIIKVPLQPGMCTTNCVACQKTCHKNCGIKNDNKKECSVMTDGMCTNCKCSWTKHVNNDFLYDYQEYEVKNTMDDLLAKYKVSDSGTINGIMQIHTQQLQKKFSADMAQMELITTYEQKNLEQLKNVIKTLNTQIANERQNMRPGYLDRVNVLEQQLNRVMQYCS